MPKKEEAFSIRFSFVLGRLLEGTFGGPPSLGIWPITAQRTAFGWGLVTEAIFNEAFPKGQPITHLGIEALVPQARPFRSRRYQRIRSEKDCKNALVEGHRVSAAFEITEQWRQPARGIIHLDLPNDEYIGAHNVGITRFDARHSHFAFDNRHWGRSWGSQGWGYLPQGFFDRYLIDAWTSTIDPISFDVQRADADSDLLVHEGTHSIDGIPYFLCLQDSSTKDYYGWVAAVLVGGVLHIDDLFVVPRCRTNGVGRYLAQVTEELSHSLDASICLWVPWADHDTNNIPRVRAIAKRLGLNINPSGVRWAAYKCTSDGPTDSDLALGWIPERPSLRKLASPQAAVTVMEEWSDAMNIRRLFLIGKKFSAGLDDGEIAELALLHNGLSKHLNTQWPLPFDQLKFFNERL